VRVSIVHPFLETGSSEREEPLGAEYLAAVAEAHDHEVQLVDGYGFNLDEDGLFEQVSGFAPDLLAVSVPMSPQFPDGDGLARRIRASRPDTTICFGGNYPTFAVRELIVQDHVDLIVLHEGELAFAAMLEALDGGDDPASVAGVVTRATVEAGDLAPHPLIEDLDTLPLPARHLTPSYAEVYQVLSLVASRGCPYSCINCSTTEMWQRRRRTRSVDSVLAEIELLLETYPVRALNFVDDLLTADRRWIHQLCDRYEPLWARHSAAWMCNTRVDRLDGALIEHMGAVGCRMLFLGVESGSRRVLEEIGKRYDADRVIELLLSCVSNGIQPNVALMMGLPSEQAADLKATTDLARRIVDEVPSAVANVRPVTPILGTPLYADAEALGITIEKDDQFHLELKEPRISTRHLSRRDLAAALLECKIVLSRAAGTTSRPMEAPR